VSEPDGGVNRDPADVVPAFPFAGYNGGMKAGMDFTELLPDELRALDDPQTALPRVAKDRRLTPPY
jgi:hypothetical protein